MAASISELDAFRSRISWSSCLISSSLSSTARGRYRGRFQRDPGLPAPPAEALGWPPRSLGGGSRGGRGGLGDHLPPARALPAGPGAQVPTRMCLRQALTAETGVQVSSGGGASLPRLPPSQDSVSSPNPESVPALPDAQPRAGTATQGQGAQTRGHQGVRAKVGRPLSAP